MKFLNKRKLVKQSAENLYSFAVSQGRTPWFYAQCGVTDDVNGRFEMIAMHVFLLLQRIKQSDIADSKLGQALFDVMFRDMDQSLREMGAGDLGVGKRVKAMAKSFYGRVAAYEAALDDPSVLAEVVIKNVYGGDRDYIENAKDLADYINLQAAHLKNLSKSDLLSGQMVFKVIV